MPKKLYLVRHAKSSWDEQHLPDMERPLSEKGLKDSVKMAKSFISEYKVPDKLISSPARRALVTAQRFAETINYPAGKIKTNEDLYESGMDELFSVIKDLKDKFDSVMLFGHNPGFTNLANSLCGEFTDNIPTCGIACIRLKVDSWSEVTEGCGELVFFDFPKNHKNEEGENRPEGSKD